MNARSLLRLAPILLLAGSAFAKPEGFYLERLPKGKDVTMPRPATTFVPMSARVQLTSTDLPQTLSLRAVNVSGGKVAPIRIAIYDPNSERVNYVDVRPGTPILYSFKALGAITVIPNLPQGAVADDNLKLQIESDKPLTIAH